MSKFIVDDLGIADRGNAWLGWRMAREPGTGTEMAIAALSKGGFLLFEPKTRRTIRVRNDWPEFEVWAVAQAADGSIYASTFDNNPKLLRWNWQGDRAERVADVPSRGVFRIDASPDGSIYIPNSRQHTLYRYKPSDGLTTVAKFDAYGNNILSVACDAEGWVYVDCFHSGKKPVILAINPADNSIHPLAFKEQPYTVLPNSRNEAIAITSSDKQRHYYELRGGKVAGELPYEKCGLNDDNRPLIFSDGGRIDVPDREEICDDNATVTYVAPDGSKQTFDIDRQQEPLRLFSVAAGAGRVWMSTFIPLFLASYELSSGKFTHHGNPARSTGEIYSIVHSRGNIYTASYTSAPIARYDPKKPWNKGFDASSNPRHLGYMKEDGLNLQRPLGNTIDPEGNVFFAARGDYGCVDSGVCRVDAGTDNLTRWIYKDRTVGAMTYAKSAKALLIAERRDGEGTLRATLLSPTDGSEIWSVVLKNDEGNIVSWLDSGDDWVYGLHGHRATLLAFSLRERRAVKEIPELRVGDHCYNALTNGLDGRVWGLTNECIYAAERDLSGVEVVAPYKNHLNRDFYRFGLVQAEDGAIYFPNGPHLMRIREV